MASSHLSSAYKHLPYLGKVVFASGYGWFGRRKKYGSLFESHFKLLTSTSAGERAEIAERELRAYLKEALNAFPFFSKYLKKTPMITDFPIIDKRTVLQNYNEFCAEKPYLTNNSSGTSGQPLPVPYCKNAYQKEYAFWWYHRSFGGVKRGDRVATFAGHKVAEVERDRPPFWVYNAAENQTLFSSYHMSSKNLSAYIDQLNRFKPIFMHGYPSSLYLIAKYVLDTNTKLSFTPKMVVGSSETTLDFQRKAIESAFNCKLFIWYGNTELCGHITECLNGKLHAQPYHSHMRVITDTGKDAGPGEEGRIVATNFSNKAFALINYDLKDYVRVSREQHCPCEQGGLILDYILGRIEEYVMTPEGRMVGRLDHLFKDAKNVRNGQIEQPDINRVIIRIEKEPGYSSKVEEAILKEARVRLGSSIRVDFDYVNEIEKGPNGKFNFVIQRISDINKRGLSAQA